MTIQPDSALVAFVRDAPDGITELRDVQDAIAVLDILLKEGMSAKDLLLRSAHWIFGGELFSHVVSAYGEHYGSRGFKAIASAIAQMPQSWWDENDLDPNWFLSSFRGHDVLDHLLTHHREVILHPNAPLYYYDVMNSSPGLLFVDDYWAHKVRRFIVRGDLRRAWDELQIAHRGILNATVTREQFTDPASYIDACTDPMNRCWHASSEMIGMLAMELFDALFDEEDRLMLLTRNRDCTGRQETIVYRGGKKPTSYPQSFDRPQFRMAMLFRDFSRYDERSQNELRSGRLYWVNSFYNLHHFMDEGAAILAIADYFAAKKREKKRLKYEKDLKAYERKVARKGKK